MIRLVREILALSLIETSSGIEKVQVIKKLEIQICSLLDNKIKKTATTIIV